VVPPAVWLGLERVGSGNALTQVINPFAGVRTCAGCAVVTVAPRLGALPAGAATGLRALGALPGAIAWPALALAAVATVMAIRRRRRDVLLVAAVAAVWLLIVVGMTQIGYPGSRRYLLGPAALVAVLAGLGVTDLLGLLGARRGRALLASGLVASIIASGAPATLSNLRLVSVARAQASAFDELGDAIIGAGGRGAVIGAGRPAINPEKQSALAWRLDVPLASVQAAWGSSRRRPHWSPPALVFRTSSRLAGPAPYLGRGRRARVVARTAAWTVFAAP
jgi:hypothetical protein